MKGKPWSEARRLAQQNKKIIIRKYNQCRGKNTSHHIPDR